MSNIPIHSKPTSEFMEVTPELAQEWLGANLHNRNIRPTVVAAFARDAANGKWAVNGETVKFDVNGHLIDGQHRLQAIVASGVPVTLLVVSGLAPDAQESVDAGVTRTAADAAVLRGIPHAMLQTAAARLALLLSTGDNNLNRKITNTEVLDFIENNPDLENSARRASEYRKDLKGARPSLLVYADFILSRIDREAASNFWHAATALVPGYEGDPAVALARRFADIYVKRIQLSDLETLDLIYRTWNKRRRFQAARVVKLLPVSSVSELTVPK